ncbi:MAG TPA: DinB family protein [Anaerolineaceae bacterium]|nr:DinB family protein [Anaerolineaceae bacterium]
MKIRVGMENNIEGRSLAWAVDHPGCFAYGPDGKSAIVNMAQAIPAYIRWMEHHTPDAWFQPEAINIDLVDVWDCYTIDDNYARAAQGYEVNAWFLTDWVPLSAQDVEHGLQLLSWSRTDLLLLVSDLTEAHLDQERLGERWSIRGILKHVATAEWWYLDRLGCADQNRENLANDAFERLEAQRNRLQAVLPELVGVERVVGVDGEFWSPRKLMRRSVWHEMDHFQHIQRLLLEGARRPQK